MAPQNARYKFAIIGDPTCIKQPDFNSSGPFANMLNGELATMVCLALQVVASVLAAR